MEVEPTYNDPEYYQNKQRIIDSLEEDNLRYEKGGKIVPIPKCFGIDSLFKALKKRDFGPLEIEFKRALSGMTSIVDGIGYFITHGGSAHGGGKLRYKISQRHARLTVNSAHTLSAFLPKHGKRKIEAISNKRLLLDSIPSPQIFIVNPEANWNNTRKVI